MLMNIKILASGHINLVVTRILIYLLFSVSLVQLKQKITKPNPEPGEILQSLKREISGTDSTEIPSIESLEEQKKVAEEKLKFFLSNISASPESRKVVEQFYEEEHGKKIDTSEINVLIEKVPSIESIINSNKLPVVDKDDLRDHFHVADPNKYNPLSPRWASKENRDRVTVESSGTTGPAWKRLLTENDLGMVVLNVVRHINRLLSDNNIYPSETNAVLIAPKQNLGTRGCYAGLNCMGVDVELAQLRKLKSGGEEAIKETQRLVSHINESEESIIISSLEQMMSGGVGVAIRRGELDASMYMNMGKPMSEEYKNKLEQKGYVGNIYGETEYPQAGTFMCEINGKEGFDLPFETQINLIYDEETGELSYEGTGRFAYLPFGSEGQVIPGVYVSGVEATIEKVGDKRQLLKDVERVQDPERGCYASY
jgi:phenylacetate-coenzyme A ligase PaaK-like adenylate-forming protein